MVNFISNSAHYKEVLSRVQSVKHSLWIGTADIKDLYIEDGKSKKPFLEVLAKLIKKGVAVRLIHAKEPGPNFLEDFDRFPILYDGLERVLRPRQEIFQPINGYINVERLIREYYLPKMQRERMSSKLLEKINQRITNLKLDVVTRDFDKYGAVSINATYKPIGFDSWDDYLKSIL